MKLRSRSSLCVAAAARRCWLVAWLETRMPFFCGAAAAEQFLRFFLVCSFKLVNQANEKMPARIRISIS